MNETGLLRPLGKRWLTLIAVAMMLGLPILFQEIASAEPLRGQIRHEATIPQQVSKAQVGVVGLEFRITGQGYPIVQHVLPGLPAAKAGLKPGDILMAVDGWSTWDASRWAVDRAISNIPGTLVKITVQRKDTGKVTLPVQVTALEQVPNTLQSWFRNMVP